MRTTVFLARKGFIMVYVIAISFAFAMMFYGIVSLMGQMDVAHDFVEWTVRYEIETKNARNSAFILDEFVNSNGTGEDLLSCSGGVISCSSEGVSCSSNEWIVAPDGIDDGCDNDDGTPYYWTGSVGNLLSTDSKTEDDDDAARIAKIGFVPPGEVSTVFAMDAKTAVAISLRDDNAAASLRATPISWPFALRLKASQTGGEITVFRMDRQSYDQDRKTVVLDRKTGQILETEGTIDENGSSGHSGNPYLFDAAAYDYALRLKNVGTTALFYEIRAETSGIPTYIVPIEKTELSKRLIPYPYYGSALE